MQMDVSMRRVQFARAKGPAGALRRRLPRAVCDGSFSTVLLIAMLEHTSEPWRVLAEARRVLKPGGRAIIVVPNDVTMSAGRLVLGKFPIRYPDHLTFTTPGRMHRWLTHGFRIAEEFPAAVPAAAVCGESLLLHGRGGGVVTRMAKPKVVILGAGPAGISAAWRLTKLGYPVTVLERDGAVGGMGRTIKVGDYSRRLRSAHVSHPRDAREQGDPEDHHAVLREDPLTLTRGTRVLLRGKEYVYPLEMLQVLFGVSPILSFRILFDYSLATLKSFFAAGEERGLVRGMGRPQSRPHALRLVLRHLLGARVGTADQPDLVEAGAARRETESQEHHPAHARHQGRSGHLLHEVFLPAQGHQPAVRRHGRRGDRRPGTRCCLHSPAVRVERNGDKVSRVIYKTSTWRTSRSTATCCCRPCRCRRSST